MSWRSSRVASDGTHHVKGGEPLYAERFDEVLKFHEPGLAPVRSGGSAWHILPDGSEAYGRRFRRTFGFYEGFSAVRGEGGWHHIRPDGTDLYVARYAWCGNFQGSRCTVRDRTGNYFHISTYGKPAYEARWRYAGDFRDNIAVVQAHDGRSTHIHLDGQQLHGRWFLDLDVFHKGFARARDDDGWTHVDANGRPVYSRRFAAVEPFYNGQARVEKFDGGLEVIDESGITVLVLRNGAGRCSWLREKSTILLNERYRFDPEAPMARSSHGAIWLARDLQGGRDVVVKSSSCGEGHRRELHALRVLRDHPSAPRHTDHFSLGVSHYLVMDVAPGTTIGGRSHCDRMGTRATLDLLKRVADLVSKLHQAGFVHSDLHPGNILVSTEAGQHRVTVLDYEFTVPMGAEGRWRGEVHWGRWEFVPPEQFEGFRELDPTVDTYALACLFCFYASGHVPFRVDSAAYKPKGWTALRRAFMDTRCSPDLTGLPEHLHPPLQRALSANPAQRFQRAGDLVAVLAAAISRNRN